MNIEFIYTCHFLLDLFEYAYLNSDDTTIEEEKDEFISYPISSKTFL